MCFYAAGGRREDLAWAAAAERLRSWAEGAGGADSPQSPTRCAWAELHSRHELERRGADSDTIPAATFIRGLAEMGLSDSRGWTILHHGAAARAPAALRTLLHLKQDDLERHPATVTREDNQGRSPIQVVEDNTSIALLLQARAGLEVRDDRCCGALAEAARLCLDAQVIQMLLEARCNVDSEEAPGQSPLHHAAASCSSASGAAVLRSLLAARARPGAEGAAGRRPLHAARDSATVRTLVAYGAKVNEPDMRGASPLHLAAARRGGADAVAELLRLRADLNAADQDRRTPLMLAASAAAARELLRARADAAAKDAGGSGALHHAASSNRTAVAAELLAIGGSALLWRNGASETPLDLAAHAGHRGFMEVLLASVRLDDGPETAGADGEDL